MRVLFLLAISVCFASPTGFMLKSGEAEILPAVNAKEMLITAGSIAEIDWKSFSIAQDETVRFLQPNENAKVFNFVTGCEPSFLYGSLLATGEVYLINPNGFVIGEEAKIQTAGFLASTYDLFHGDFNQQLKEARRFVEADEMNPYAHAIRHLGSIKAKNIRLFGDKVLVEDNALLDASGDFGGGSVLLGGDFQGKNLHVPNADYTFVGKNVTILADALERGDGGKVIIWSDQRTEYYGSVSAKGGSLGGDGGFVEVSGEELIFRGPVTTAAPFGKTGDLLLDPTNISIGTSSTTGTLPACSGGSSTFQPDGSFLNQILNTDLQNRLASCNVIVQTASGGSAPGAIGVNASITWSSANTLTLQASSTIMVGFGSPIIANGGGSLVLIADGAGTAADPNSGITINASITMTTGAITMTGTSLGNSAVQNTFGVNFAGGSGGNVHSDSGTITITGTASGIDGITGVNAGGVGIFSTITTTSGAIIINGVANGGIGTNSTPGVLFGDNVSGNGGVHTTSGVIQITGTSNSGAGILYLTEGYNGLRSSTASITFTGVAIAPSVGDGVAISQPLNTGTSGTVAFINCNSSGGAGINIGATLTTPIVIMNASSTTSYGILYNGVVTATQFTLSGQSASTHGIYVAATTTFSGSNTINFINSSGGSNASSYGVAIAAPVTSTAPLLFSTCTAGTGTGSAGVGITATLSVSNNITATNLMGAGSNQTYGFYQNAPINATGNISISTTSAGSNMVGIGIAAGATMTVVGSGNSVVLNGAGNTGVLINGAVDTTANNGSITVSGGGTLAGSTAMLTAGSGTITITGGNYSVASAWSTNTTGLLQFINAGSISVVSLFTVEGDLLFATCSGLISNTQQFELTNGTATFRDCTGGINLTSLSVNGGIIFATCTSSAAIPAVSISGMESQGDIIGTNIRATALSQTAFQAGLVTARGAGSIISIEASTESGLTAIAIQGGEFVTDTGSGSITLTGSAPNGTGVRVSSNVSTGNNSSTITLNGTGGGTGPGVWVEDSPNTNFGICIINGTTTNSATGGYGVFIDDTGLGSSGGTTFVTGSTDSAAVFPIAISGTSTFDEIVFQSALGGVSSGGTINANSIVCNGLIRGTTTLNGSGVLTLNAGVNASFASFNNSGTITVGTGSTQFIATNFNVSAPMQLTTTTTVLNMSASTGNIGSRLVGVRPVTMSGSITCATTVTVGTLQVTGGTVQFSGQTLNVSSFVSSSGTAINLGFSGTTNMNSSGGISFGGLLNGVSANSQNVSVTAVGSLTFSNVGNVTPLGTVRVNNASNATVFFAGTQFNASALTIPTANAVLLNDLTLNLAATFGGTINGTAYTFNVASGSLSVANNVTVGGLSLSAPTTLAGNVTFDVVGNATFNSTISGGANALTVDAPNMAWNGSAITASAITLIGDSALSATTTFTSSSGTVSVNGSLTGSGSVFSTNVAFGANTATITPISLESGRIEIANTATLTLSSTVIAHDYFWAKGPGTVRAQGTIAAGVAMLNDPVDGDIQFDTGVTLTGALDLEATGSVSFMSTVDGAYPLTIDAADALFVEHVGASSALESLVATVTGTATVQKSQTVATGPMSYSGAVALNATQDIQFVNGGSLPTSFDSITGTVSCVISANDAPVTVSGNVDLSNTVGSAGNFTVNGTSITISGDIETVAVAMDPPGGDGGMVLLEASAGSVSVNNITASSQDGGFGGNIFLSAAAGYSGGYPIGRIIINGDLVTVGTSGGGDINLSSSRSERSEVATIILPQAATIQMRGNSVTFGSNEAVTSLGNLEITCPTLRLSDTVVLGDVEITSSVIILNTHGNETLLDYTGATYVSPSLHLVSGGAQTVVGFMVPSGPINATQNVALTEEILTYNGYLLNYDTERATPTPSSSSVEFGNSFYQLGIADSQLSDILPLTYPSESYYKQKRKRK